MQDTVDQATASPRTLAEVISTRAARVLIDNCPSPWGVSGLVVVSPSKGCR
jgi:hypothetical protein